MERLIAETHAHYTANRFNKNRTELLESLPSKGVAFVVDCGTDLETSQESLGLAKKYPFVYTAVGIHPQSLIEDDASTNTQFDGDWRAELKAMMPLFEEEKVVAVGEAGLDHHWPVPRDEQIILFEEQIKLAMELELPLIVHDREAHEETYRLLKKYKPRGVLHSFSGSAEDAKWLCKQGMYIGFTGVVTFKNAKHPLQVSSTIPDECLVLETDCPYMAPEPFRGKTSDSSMIFYIAEKIASLRGVSTEALLRQTMENAKRLFAISDQNM